MHDDHEGPYLMVYTAYPPAYSLLNIPQHGVGLAAASLAIGKDARVVPRQTVVHNWFAHHCI